jgi:hypothetical protein
MKKSHWQAWLEKGRRDDVMMGAYLGDGKARILMPDVPECASSLSAFIADMKKLPWESKEEGSAYHKLLVRIAVALGRAVLPAAMKINKTEAAPDVLHTTEAWLVWPTSFVTAALERLFFTSPGPNSPREFQMPYDAGGVAMSPKYIDPAVKTAVKILGAKPALRAVIDELGAFLIDRDDPVERSIGKRVFLCLTIYDKNRKEAKVNKFPAGWDKPTLTAGGPMPDNRAFKLTAGEYGEILPNALELFLVSGKFKKMLESFTRDFEYIECSADGKPVWWVRPRTTHAVMAADCIGFDDFKFLMLDANKCAKAPAIFFARENPRFVCFDLSFTAAYYKAGLKGLFAAVIPFGVPLAKKKKPKRKS